MCLHLLRIVRGDISFWGMMVTIDRGMRHKHCCRRRGRKCQRGEKLKHCDCGPVVVEEPATRFGTWPPRLPSFWSHTLVVVITR